MKKYQGFRTWNISQPNVRRIFVLLMISTAFIFAIAGGISMFQAKNASNSKIGDVTSHLTAKTLIMLMGEETPYLKESVQTPDPKGVVTNLLLELATSIDPKDPRTFLGRELPMFAVFDTKIVTASADVDYTDIPIDSPPPPELEQEIKKAEKSKPTPAPPPVQTTLGPKRVFIYHSHWYESYLPELKKKKPNQTNASDVNINIMSVGYHMAKEFQKQGIGVQTITKPNTGAKNAYTHSRNLVTSAMKQNNQINYLIDIHRDSKRRDKTTLTINGKPMARLAFVVGKGSKNYAENLKLANELFEEINRLYPKLCTGVYEKARTGGNNGEYNQSLSTGAMLVEVGGVDNNFAEANASVEVLAKIIAERIHKEDPAKRKE